MESELAPRSAAVSGKQSTANGTKPVSSVKSSKVFKCKCISALRENNVSSDAESVSSAESDSSTASVASSNANSEASFIIVSDSPTHTKQKCCLQQRCWSVFDSERFSDVTFIVRKQRILAHRVILSVGSDVFNTLFSEDWPAVAAEIKVWDVEPSAFKALLRFLYTDDTSITYNNVAGIMYAAKKYAVQPLVDKCLDFLAKNLCPSNAFTVLKEARSFNNQKLVNLCLEKIDEDTLEALLDPGFLDIDVEMLCSILKRNTLTTREIEIFKAVLEWCRNGCYIKERQRLKAKDVLPLIRFPLMTVVEFSSEVAPSGLLSNEELLPMFWYLTTLPRPPTDFNDSLRLPLKELAVSRFKTCEVDYTQLTGESDHSDFTVDVELNLLGCALYGSVEGATKYEVKLQLVDTLTGVLLRDETGDFFCDGTSVTYRALFTDPVKLIPHKEYTARAFVKGPGCLIGLEKLKEVTAELLHGQKVTVTFSTHDVNGLNPSSAVEHGFISGLIFEI